MITLFYFVCSPKYNLEENPVCHPTLPLRVFFKLAKDYTTNAPANRKRGCNTDFVANSSNHFMRWLSTPNRTLLAVSCAPLPFSPRTNKTKPLTALASSSQVDRYAWPKNRYYYHWSGVQPHSFQTPTTTDHEKLRQQKRVTGISLMASVFKDWYYFLYELASFSSRHSIQSVPSHLSSVNNPVRVTVYLYKILYDFVPQICRKLTFFLLIHLRHHTGSLLQLIVTLPSTSYELRSNLASSASGYHIQTGPHRHILASLSMIYPSCFSRNLTISRRLPSFSSHSSRLRYEHLKHSNVKWLVVYDRI